MILPPQQFWSAEASLPKRFAEATKSFSPSNHSIKLSFFNKYRKRDMTGKVGFAKELTDVLYNAK